MRCRLWAGGVWLAALLAGCGPDTLIEVTVESQLRAPEQIDALTLTVLDVDSRAEIDVQQIDPTVHAFPVVVLYEPDGALSDRLSLVVVGLLETVDVARIAVEYRWKAHRTNEVTVTLGP